MNFPDMDQPALKGLLNSYKKKAISILKVEVPSEAAKQAIELINLIGGEYEPISPTEMKELGLKGGE